MSAPRDSSLIFMNSVCGYFGRTISKVPIQRKWFLNGVHVSHGGKVYMFVNRALITKHPFQYSLFGSFMRIITMEMASTHGKILVLSILAKNVSELCCQQKITADSAHNSSARKSQHCLTLEHFDFRKCVSQARKYMRSGMYIEEKK